MSTSLRRQNESRRPEQGAELATNETFELLSNDRRRYALHHLKRTERESLGSLARRIASWENEIELEEVSAAQRKRVYTSLQQFHLPKMEEQGIVEFDDRAGEISLGPAAEGLDVYLEVVSDRDVPWSQYYLGIAAIDVLVVAGVAADVAPLTALSDLAWGVFFVTTLAISALVHSYYHASTRLGSSEHPPDVDGGVR